jgi:hypothetical protein
MDAAISRRCQGVLLGFVSEGTYMDPARAARILRVVA